jgi:hypothetical protein
MHSPQLGQIGAFGSKFMPAGYQVLPTETVTRITINSRLHFWSIVAKFLAAELISIAGNDSGDLFSPILRDGWLK